MENAVNCQACGLECFSSELAPIKLGEFIFDNLQICASCHAFANAEGDFKEAAEIIISTFESIPEINE